MLLVLLSPNVCVTFLFLPILVMYAPFWAYVLISDDSFLVSLPKVNLYDSYKRKAPPSYGLTLVNVLLR